MRSDRARVGFSVYSDVRLSRGLSHIGLLFCGRRQRAKSLDAEGADRRVGNAVKRKARDRVRSDGRQQNSIAMMPGGIDEPIERAGAEDRGGVEAHRPQADATS